MLYKSLCEIYFLEHTLKRFCWWIYLYIQTNTTNKSGVYSSYLLQHISADFYGRRQLFAQLTYKRKYVRQRSLS